MPTYWPEQWELIQSIQNAKRSHFNLFGYTGVRSDAYVLTNPITGQDVPIDDLRYARAHLDEIYNSNQIKEDRWAFLWYH